MKRSVIEKEDSRKSQKWESIYVGSSDEEYDDLPDATLRSRLISNLAPVLPMNPEVWARINRWWQRGAPRILLQILVMFMLLHYVEPRQWDLVEYFAGKAMLSDGFRFARKRVYSYELKDNPLLNDFLGPQGFLTAVCICFALADISMGSFAPVCASWVWVGRSRSGRSHAYPLGEDVHWVRAGNCQVARCVLLVAWLQVRNILWVLEQPLNTWLHLHPLFQWLIRMFEGKIFKFSLQMQKLGAQSVKPTVLWCNFEWIDQLMEYTYLRKGPDLREETTRKL